MIKGGMAALVLAASVVAAAGQPSTRGPVSRLGATAGGQRSGTAAPAGVQRFQFRGLVFTIPASWSVKRADNLRPHVEYVAGPTGLSGPRLTFSDTVQLIQLAAAPAQRVVPRRGRGLTIERFEMPNPASRGVIYLIRDAGISISAQLRTDAEAREADRVVYSARWAVSPPAPKAS